MFFVQTSTLPPSMHQKLAKTWKAFYAKQQTTQKKLRLLKGYSCVSKKPEYNVDVLVKRFIYSDGADPIGSEVRQYFVDMTS